LAEGLALVVLLLLVVAGADVLRPSGEEEEHPDEQAINPKRTINPEMTMKVKLFRIRRLLLSPHKI
jgi:hypothetical protein